MGTILLIDDKPIMATNLAKEWEQYYKSMHSQAVCPKFYVTRIYDENAVKEDVDRNAEQINKKLITINQNIPETYYRPIILQKSGYEEKISELEAKISEMIDEIAGTDSFLMALDLHLFYGDLEALRKGEAIMSMYIYKIALEKGKKVMLYTSYLDENQLAALWKKAYVDRLEGPDCSIYARESALNYDVMVVSAKKLLDEVVGK